MAQNGLTRRVDALEEVADRMRRREMRDLILSWPEAADLTPAELEEATGEALSILARTAQWRREGLSQQEIIQRGANELGRLRWKLGMESGAAFDLPHRKEVAFRRQIPLPELVAEPHSRRAAFARTAAGHGVAVVRSTGCGEIRMP